ncbi:unnamed protein product, partial [Larinioides sclopetarius]
CAKGIGNALAKHLDSKGFHVFASCRDPSTPGADDLRRSCSKLWAVINNAGIQKGFLLELTSIQDFKDSLEVNAVGPARVTKTFLPLLRQSKGRVINIASLLEPATSIQDFKDSLEMNAVGPARVTKAFLPLLRQSKGRVINIASLLAFPMAGPYSMSKFACVGFSESLRYELDFFGVKVISIEPEFFQTDMTTEKGISQRIDSMFAKVDEDVRKDYGEEFLKAFQHTASTLFPPSPNMQKLVETVEDAVSLKHPDAVYKVCRNVGVRALWTVMDVLPAEFKVFLERIVYNLLGIPKPGQAKKGMKILVKCI